MPISVRIAFKALADAGGKLVTLLVAMAAARTLAADAFGVLALGMTTGWLLGIATDTGLSMYLARETARQPGRARALFGEVMTIRTCTAYTAAALVALFVSSFVPSQWRLPFLLIVLAQITGAVLETICHLFRGLERSEIESAIQLSQRAVTLIAALVVLTWWPRLDYLGGALLAPPVIATIVAGVIAINVLEARAKALALHVIENHPPVEGSHRLDFRRFVRDVLPLGIATLVSALYFRCDLYFVEKWQGLEAVGAYNAVFRLIEAMRLVPAAILAVTFPLLCKATDLRLLQRIAGGLAVLGLVFLASFAPFSGFIVRTVYGVPFESAGPTFAILTLALPLLFLNYALTHQVIGWDGQLSFLWISLAALIANVAANLWLVPSYGMNGAAWATLITEVVVTAGCVIVLWIRPLVPSADRRPVGVA
jgi:O-antigen/teichoic acid export membrane protein